MKKSTIVFLETLVMSGIFAPGLNNALLLRPCCIIFTFVEFLFSYGLARNLVYSAVAGFSHPQCSV
jgi:hypothetical protein